MKKQLPLFLLLTIVFTINSYSQIIFEKGYYINNSNQKINCLIKNLDWKNNPTEFEYKQTENSDVKKATIKSVQEFGIYNTSKYFRKIVEIDQSSNNIGYLSTDKNPIFKKTEIFLKVLVEGKANLYSFEDGFLRRFFYSLETSNIEQLIYKRYKSSENKVGQNNRFRNQLWNDLKCSTIKMNNLKNLKYAKSNLISFFSKYNTCSNSEFINYDKKQKRDLFNLTLRPRINSSSLATNNASNVSRSIDFGNKLSFGFGVEAEFILPFNKNKWAILIEPTYQRFKAEKTIDASNVSGGKLTGDVNYSSIEIPVGLRHYFFLNENSKIFINAAFIFDLGSTSSIKFKRANNTNLNSFDIKTEKNMAFGLGYKFNNQYSIEIRHQTSRDLLKIYNSHESDYKTLSIIFGYSIF